MHSGKILFVFFAGMDSCFLQMDAFAHEMAKRRMIRAALQLHMTKTRSLELLQLSRWFSISEGLVSLEKDVMQFTPHQTLQVRTAGCFVCVSSAGLSSLCLARPKPTL